MACVDYETFLSGNEPYIAELTKSNIFDLPADPEAPSTRLYVVMEVSDNHHIRKFMHDNMQLDFWRRGTKTKMSSKSVWEFGKDWRQLGAIWIVTDDIDEGLFLFAQIMRQLNFIGKLQPEAEFTQQIRQHFINFMATQYAPQPEAVPH